MIPQYNVPTTLPLLWYTMMFKYLVPIHLTDMQNNLKFLFTISFNIVMGHVHPCTSMFKHKHLYNSRSTFHRSIKKRSHYALNLTFMPSKFLPSSFCYGLWESETPWNNHLVLWIFAFRLSPFRLPLRTSKVKKSMKWSSCISTFHVRLWNSKIRISTFDEII